MAYRKKPKRIQKQLKMLAHVIATAILATTNGINVPTAPPAFEVT